MLRLPPESHLGNRGGGCIVGQLRTAMTVYEAATRSVIGFLAMGDSSWASLKMSRTRNAQVVHKVNRVESVLLSCVHRI